MLGSKHGIHLRLGTFLPNAARATQSWSRVLSQENTICRSILMEPSISEQQAHSAAPGTMQKRMRCFSSIRKYGNMISHSSGIIIHRHTIDETSPLTVSLRGFMTHPLSAHNNVCPFACPDILTARYPASTGGEPAYTFVAEKGLKFTPLPTGTSVSTI